VPLVVKLEKSSDDELYRPMPPRFGDTGQGSSRQAPPPQDDDSLIRLQRIYNF
jgi:hypothetical protein